MKTLTIGEIQIPQGFRILSPQIVDFEKRTGLTVVNGKSGGGKSTLLEVMKLSTQGKDALRDNYVVREGENESEIMVKIACEQDAAIDFFICAKIKPTGEVTYSFKVEKDGKLKTSKSLPEIGEITPSKLFDMISTTLTYGAADFMSENPKTQREFIFKTYPEVRDIAKSIDEQIEAAIKERDKVSELQSAIGAYANKLDDKVQPEWINMEALYSKRGKAIDDLSQAKADDKAFAANIESKISAKEQELENVKLKAQDVKRKISEYNTANRNEDESEKKEIERKIAQFTSALDKIREGYFVFYPNCDDEAWYNFSFPYRMTIGQFEDSLSNFSQRFQITDNAVSADMPDDDSKSLVSELEVLRKQYGKIESELKSMREQEIPTNPESKVEQCEESLRLIDIEIKNAEESNDLWTKFDTLYRYKELNQKVIDLRIERNKIYEGIDTGVKGLKIQTTDDAGSMLGFFYDGSYKPEYFSNKNGDLRPITSYSKSQKTLVAAMLQCYLMKRRAFALNVICIDDTGMDSVVYELYDKFAQKHGLLMFVTSTNDKTASDLRDGEVLIEGGEVVVKHVEK